MNILEQIGNGLKDRRLDIVSEKTGINRNTLARIRDGIQRSANSNTINALAQYFGLKVNL